VRRWAHRSAAGPYTSPNGQNGREVLDAGRVPRNHWLRQGSILFVLVPTRAFAVGLGETIGGLQWRNISDNEVEVNSVLLLRRSIFRGQNFGCFAGPKANPAKLISASFRCSGSGRKSPSASGPAGPNSISPRAQLRERRGLPSPKEPWADVPIVVIPRFAAVPWKLQS